MGLLWVTPGPDRGGAPTAELVVVSLLVGGWVCWSVCFGLMWDDDDNTTTNHNNNFCQQSTGLGVGGVVASPGCRVALTWDCGSVLPATANFLYYFMVDYV